MCGVAAVLLMFPLLADTKLVLQAPLDHQVVQRNAQGSADLLLQGAVPLGTTLVEVRAELGADMRGYVVDWTAVA